MAEHTDYEIILSVNGKHITVTTWSDEYSHGDTIEWVRQAFKQMVVEHFSLSDKKRTEFTPNAPYCEDHQLPMVWRSGKYGSFWSCPHRGDDGSYCRYRPPKS